jgi:cell division septation protein DedD
MKDKQIPEEELLVELDSMYQRVADIEKEEAAETLTPEKKKPKQNKKRSYRSFIIVASISFMILASILTVTILKPTIIPQLLKMDDSQPSKVVTPPPARPKRPAVVPPPAAPKPPAVVSSPELPKPPSAATSPAPSPAPSVAPSPEPPKTPSESPPVQKKQEAVKTIQPEVKKEEIKPTSQESEKPNIPSPQGKYYAIQVGAFSEMENVRELVEAFKKEGLEAYWITMKSRSRGTLYRVLVGQFMNENEAAQFLKEKKILKNYPDSFIKEISSSKMNR